MKTFRKGLELRASSTTELETNEKNEIVLNFISFEIETAYVSVILSKQIALLNIRQLFVHQM